MSTQSLAIRKCLFHHRRDECHKVSSTESGTEERPYWLPLLGRGIKHVYPASQRIKPFPQCIGLFIRNRCCLNDLLSKCRRCNHEKWFTEGPHIHVVRAFELARHGTKRMLFMSITGELLDVEFNSHKVPKSKVMLEHRLGGISMVTQVSSGDGSNIRLTKPLFRISTKILLAFHNLIRKYIDAGPIMASNAVVISFAHMINALMWKYQEWFSGLGILPYMVHTQFLSEHPT